MTDDDEPHECLEILSNGERLKKLQSTLEKLDANNKRTKKPDFSFLNQPSKPCYVPPPTELLSRVQAFLPAFEASTTLLSQQALRKPKSVNIEIEDHQESGPYIEMNLGLGVFETKAPSSFPSSIPTISQPIPVRQTSPRSSSSSASSSLSSSLSYDCLDDSDSDAEIITSFTPIRPTKPLPRRTISSRASTCPPPPRPLIVLDTPDHGTNDTVGG